MLKEGADSGWLLGSMGRGGGLFLEGHSLNRDPLVAMY